MTKGVRKLVLIVLDVCLAAYLIVVFSAFHTPEDKSTVCRGVSVVVADGETRGFIDSKEVIARLKKADLYPKGQSLASVNCRKIEDALVKTPFISTTKCFTTIDGWVNVEITQLMPVVRVKASNGDDYYIDDKGAIMPISNFTSDIIVASGNISRNFAMAYLLPLARQLTADEFSRNLFQQIYVDDEEGVELIPQVGDGSVYIGILPRSADAKERDRLVADYVAEKMNTLELFYRYGLPLAGWDRYSVINLSFAKQIVCKKRHS